MVSAEGNVSLKQELRSAVNDRDVYRLKRYGSSHGFQEHALRRAAWKLIIDEQYDSTVPSADRKSSVPEKKLYSRGSIFSHHMERDTVAIDKDIKQIDLDVERSFTILQDGKQRRYLREVLRTLLQQFFKNNHLLSYYQGFHDVASVFVMVSLEKANKNESTYAEDTNFVKNRELSQEVNEENDINAVLSDVSREIQGNYNGGENIIKHEEVEVAEVTDYLQYETKDEETLYKCFEAFSLLYLRDFLMETLDFPIDQLKLIQHYIQKKDAELCEKLQLDKIEPFYAISSILTLYSHELKPALGDENNKLFQIFDLIICQQSMFLPLKLYSTLFILHKNDILDNYEINIENFDNGVDLIHAVIQQILQKNLLDEQKSHKAFTEALNIVRKAPEGAPLTITSKVVNKFSPLLTTASGIQQKFNNIQMIDLVSSQVHLHEKLQKSKNKNKKRIKSLTFLTSILKYRSETQLLSPLVKMSVMIGVLAVLLRYSSHRKISFDLLANKYITESYKKIRSLNILGLSGNIRSIWTDPVDLILGIHKNLHIDTPGSPRSVGRP
ncbi:GTPase-activating protein GYP8 RNJ42_05158 [Nakaseomyces bracarensis]|uniref:GTPase-activating protein GYP8 n=1 Tax=Nakaseomyces bracarensis TaxID=273131 RepID=UPI0038727F2C